MVSLPTGIRLRVVEGASATGEPLILIHGIGASAFSWRHLLEEPPGGFRCIAPDLRGHGGSDKPAVRGAYRTGALLQDLDALFDLLELERVALAGHSMGGGIALRYARTRPDRVARLILLNPVGLAPKRLVELHRLLPAAIVRRLGSRLVPRWLVAMVLRYAAFGDTRLVTHQVVEEYWTPARDDGYAFAFHALLREFDWRALTEAERAAIRVPTLVILGGLDRVIRNVRGPARTFPNGQVVEVSDAGHCVAEERPEPVRSAIEAFLAGARFS